MKKKLLLVFGIIVFLVVGAVGSQFFLGNSAFTADVETSGVDMPTVTVPTIERPNYELFQTWTAIDWPKYDLISYIFALDADPNFQFMEVIYSGGTFKCVAFKDLKDFESRAGSLQNVAFSPETCLLTKSLIFRDIPVYGRFVMAKSSAPRYVHLP